LLGAVFVFPFLLPQVQNKANARTSLTLLPFDPNIKSSLNVLFTQASLMSAPYVLIRAAHNKISYVFVSLIKNSIQVISTNYIYLLEAIPRRYSVPQNSLFLYATAPFLLLGTVFFYHL
jgi:hypothetical protein